MYIVPVPAPDVHVLFGKSGQPRSDGVHLYDILADLEARLYPDLVKSHRGDADASAMWETGFAFEDMADLIQRMLANRYRMGRELERKVSVKQQEIVKDGIIMTPDDVELNAAPVLIDPLTKKPLDPAITQMLGTTVVTDFKTRWISNKWPIEDKRWWRSRNQLASYCHAWGANRGKLTILYMCGNWKPPLPTPPVSWELWFHPQELEEQWAGVLRHRDLMVREGRLAK